MDDQEPTTQPMRARVMAWVRYVLEGVWTSILFFGAPYLPEGVLTPIVLAILLASFFWIVVRQTIKIASGTHWPNERNRNRPVGNGDRRLRQWDRTAFFILIILPATFCLIAFRTRFPPELLFAAGMTFFAGFIWFIVRWTNQLDEPRRDEPPPDND
jgi:hypothetical protein